LPAALKASYDVLRALKEEGSLLSVQDRLASFEERQRAVGGVNGTLWKPRIVPKPGPLIAASKQACCLKEDNRMLIVA